MWGFFVKTYISASNLTMSQKRHNSFYVTDFKEQVSVVISVSCEFSSIT